MRGGATPSRVDQQRIEAAIPDRHQATFDASIPGVNYFAGWYFVGVLAALHGVETRGRAIAAIDDAMSGAAAALGDKLPAG